MSATKYDIWTDKLAIKNRKLAPILMVLQPTAEAFDLHVWYAHFRAAT